MPCMKDCRYQKSLLGCKPYYISPKWKNITKRNQAGRFFSSQFTFLFCVGKRPSVACLDCPHSRYLRALVPPFGLPASTIPSSSAYSERASHQTKNLSWMSLEKVSSKQKAELAIIRLMKKYSFNMSNLKDLLSGTHNTSINYSYTS